MAYEERNNSGILFKNDRKQNDRQPDMTGNGVIDGKPVRISAWKKTSRNGNVFLSLSFDDPRPQNNSGTQEERPSTPAPAPAPAQADDLEDIPFD